MVGYPLKQAGFLGRRTPHRANLVIPLPKKTRPPKRVVYPPWSPYRPYKSVAYQKAHPKGLKRGSERRVRRDMVWIRKMFDYEAHRVYNIRKNEENGY